VCWNRRCGGCCCCAAGFGSVEMCFAVMLPSVMLVVVGTVVLAAKCVVWHFVKDVGVDVVTLLIAGAIGCCRVVASPGPPFPWIL